MTQPVAERPARGLYSPEILAAAVSLAAWPANDALPFHGEARSRSCGSTLALDLALDAEGRVAQVGCRAHACAVGQAAASVFLQYAAGRSGAEIAIARGAIAAWLETPYAPAPDWPGFDLMAPARPYPARHGAILLAWDAALAALAQRDTLG